MLIEGFVGGVTTAQTERHGCGETQVGQLATALAQSQDQIHEDRHNAKYDFNGN